jgi:hypothetical protein
MFSHWQPVPALLAVGVTMTMTRTPAVGRWFVLGG